MPYVLKKKNKGYKIQNTQIDNCCHNFQWPWKEINPQDFFFEARSDPVYPLDS